MGLEKIYEDLITFRTNNIDCSKISPSAISDFLESKGFGEADIETNGWSVDFWIKYKKDSIVIVHSGSWWNGYSSLRIEQTDD